MVEAGLLGLLATFAGVALGLCAFADSRSSSSTSNPLVGPSDFHWPVAVLLSALTVVYVATVLAGLYPANIAVRLNPIEVVHEE